MKKLFFVALSVAFVSLSGYAQQAKIKKEDDKMKAKSAAMNDQEMKNKMDRDKMKMKGDDMNIMYPYKAEYSSQFAIGSSRYAKMVLDMWKDWDDNNLAHSNDWVADTIMYEAPNGQVTRGKDNFNKMGQEFRDRFTKVKSTVEAFMPVKAVDRNEDFVLVWGTEEDTDKDGKVTTQRLHEIWGINKDGKISYLRQYTSPVPKY